MSMSESEIQDLVAMRQVAEKAVEGADPALKEKAFEVMLQHLLSGASQPVARKRSRRNKTARPKASEYPEAKKPKKASGPKGLITALVEEGFLDDWRTLPDIQQQLRVRGHKYKQPALSPAVLSLTQADILRREARVEGKREIWVYRKYG